MLSEISGVSHAFLRQRYDRHIPMRVREYGGSGPLVLVLHGGPGATGSTGPVAQALAERFHVLEPFQRPCGAVPLTVAAHVADLRELIQSRAVETAPAIVGHSWGAMLALAYAAAYPASAGPLVLVGCGTFDADSRARLRATVEERTTDSLRRKVDLLSAGIADRNERLRAVAEALLPVYSFDPVPHADSTVDFDARAHEETWANMLRLQEEGVYPAAFKAIRSPVLMLHGRYDPHPGRMIFENLRPHVRQLGYRELDQCGHEPWFEKRAREEFFAILTNWLTDKTSAGGQRVPRADT